MGRQVQFFLHPADIPAVDDLLLTSGGVILDLRSDSEHPRIVPSLRTPRDAQLFAMATAESLLPEIRAKLVPQQNYWLLDAAKSPLVQYIGSSLDDGSLSEGRMWYDPSVWSAGGVGNESTRFPQVIFRRLKRSILKRVDTRWGREWASPTAAELFLAGRLEFRPMGGRP